MELRLINKEISGYVRPVSQLETVLSEFGLNPSALNCFAYDTFLIVHSIPF